MEIFLILNFFAKKVNTKRIGRECILVWAPIRNSGLSALLLGEPTLSTPDPLYPLAPQPLKKPGRSRRVFLKHQYSTCKYTYAYPELQLQGNRENIPQSFPHC